MFHRGSKRPMMAQKTSSWDGRLERGAKDFSEHDKNLVQRLLRECDPGMCLFLSFRFICSLFPQISSVFCV